MPKGKTMKVLQIAAAAALILAVSHNVSEAGRVTVKGVHLCCGACVAGVEEALIDVEGVSDVAADRNSKIVTFTAAGDSAAQKGIDALAKAGFHGAATHGEKKLSFPASGAKKGEKSNRIVLTGLHLCCGACVTGAQQALENVAGAATIEFDRKERIARIIGEGILVEEAVAALNAGGFHGTVQRAK
jgi:periplasmic mercuric ion binding protein